MPNLIKSLAAVLIVIAMLLALYAWVLSRRPPAVQPVKQAASAASYPVVVAAKPLPAGRPIAADALRVASLPIHPAGHPLPISVPMRRSPSRSWPAVSRPRSRPASVPSP
jgi:pilus assembly protein CpaB